MNETLIRADQCEQVARAIDAEHQIAGEFCCSSDQIHARLGLDARIARSMSAELFGEQLGEGGDA